MRENEGRATERRERRVRPFFCAGGARSLVAVTEIFEREGADSWTVVATRRAAGMVCAVGTAASTVLTAEAVPIAEAASAGRRSVGRAEGRTCAPGVPRSRERVPTEETVPGRAKFVAVVGAPPRVGAAMVRAAASYAPQPGERAISAAEIVVAMMDLRLFMGALLGSPSVFSVSIETL